MSKLSHNNIPYSQVMYENVPKYGKGTSLQDNLRPVYNINPYVTVR